MSRLYLQLWGLLVALFLVAGGAHEVLTWVPLSDAERALEEAWVAPGLRLAVASVATTSPDGRAEVVETLRWAYRTEVDVVSLSGLPPGTQQELQAQGEAVSWARGGVTLWIAIPRDDGVSEALVVGPLPTFAPPDPISRGFLLVLVSTGFAFAIGLSLRPLDAQHRRMARALKDLSEGRPPDRVGPSPAPVGATFDLLATRIQASSEARRAMLQAASHELRTPLSRLRLGLQLLALQDDAALRAERRQALDGDIAEIDRLVEELLELARTQEAPPLQPIDLAVASEVRRLWIRRGLACPEMVLHEPPGGSVWADPMGFDHALGNALMNATVHGAQEVWVRFERTVDGSVVYVDDDGPGILPADRERLLEPFQRGDSDHSGHGLGLAIVRRVLARHGGRAWLDEAPEGGLRVAMLWPRPPTSDPASAIGDR